MDSRLTKTHFMKKILLVISGLFVASITMAQDPGWPRQFKNNGSVMVVYPPQVENWQDYQSINFRMAFSLTPAYQTKQVVGVVYINATTVSDTYNHMVTLSNMNIVSVHFPGLDDATSASMEQIVRSTLNVSKTVTVSMERIVACTPKPQTTSTVNVQNDPPIIFVSNKPAIILQLEGAAVLSDATPGGIKYIVNANWPVFYDPATSNYYLFDDTEWQTATQLSGPWSFTSALPLSLINLSTNQNWSSSLKNAIPAQAWSGPGMPQIFYATTPAEIILFKGQPAMASIDGTTLTYATNTNNAIFYSNATSLYYYLAAGRWFSAPTLNGPWTFATANLPADFANIPRNSPAAGVLSSVPGTQEAADAVMIAQIPTKTTMNVSSAPAVTITYSGDPVYVAIDGTPLSYVENTNDKVIMVSNNQFYACVGGFWYLASSPQGPWALATSVPQVIYTIPSSSPVYNVTYVTQTVVVSGTVQSSYTAGYMGAFVVGVGVGVIIASGTGYYHPPYMYYPPMGYPVCYASAVTYGAYAYHPYSYYGGVSYGASYNSYTGTYSRSATAYGPYGSATAKQSYNPYTGTATRSGSVSTPYGTTSAGSAYNTKTGASGSTVQNKNAYGSSGASTYNNGHGTTTNTSHTTNNYGQTTASASNSNGAKAAGASGPNGSAAVAKSSNGDMYASKDGNVYSNSGGSWSQADNSKYNSSSSAQSSAAKSSSQYSSAQSTADKSSAQSSAAKSSASSFSKPSGSAPSSEMSSAASDRSRGSAGASSWGGGGGAAKGGGGGGWGGGGGGGGFGGGGGRR
jgi:hypothetical protein